MAKKKEKESSTGSILTMVKEGVKHLFSLGSIVESFKKKKEVVSEEKQVEKTKEVEKVEKKAKPKKNE